MVPEIIASLGTVNKYLMIITPYLPIISTGTKTVMSILIITHVQGAITRRALTIFYIVNY